MQKMKSIRKTLLVGLAYAISMLSLLGTHPVQATTISADNYFTTRSNTNAGPAAFVDSTLGNGGFQGFVTNFEGVQVDHTNWEFDMSLIGGPVASAALDFSFTSAAATDTIFIVTYSADGIVSLSDFLPAGAVPFTSFTGTTSPISLDITSLVNSSLAFSHLGFSFSIDSHPFQAFFGQVSDPMSITFTALAVPEPTTLAIFGLGLAGLGFFMTRRRRVV